MTATDHGGTLAGTTGGTLLTVLINIHPEDVLKTVVLACVGAVVSFIISVMMKWAMKKMRIL